MCSSIIEKKLNWKKSHGFLSLIFLKILLHYKKKTLKSKCHKLNVIKYVNYNKYKNIENWWREQLLLYSSFKFFEDSWLNTNVTWHDAYCQK